MYITHRSGFMMFNESWDENNRANSGRAHLVAGLLTAFTGLTEEALQYELKENILMNHVFYFLESLLLIEFSNKWHFN